ncbi:MAG: DUF5916 domain-containing protein [Lysobacterales bacterium]|jgi:hypothetical protein
MRTLRREAWAIFLAAALACFCHPSTAAGDSPRVTAGHTNAPLSIDGMLDEPAWRDAGVITNLTQQSPKPGAPTPYTTEVRVLLDADHVYFGFTCTDPEPDRVAVHTMLRDGDMNGDDTVAVVFDTLDDRATGYYFRVNAAGARQDGLISGQESYSLDWDGVWVAAARRVPGGWVAEIAIPSRTLRFSANNDHWGFNVERYIPRDRTTLRWSGLTLDSFLTDMSRNGELAGVGSLEQGLGLSVSPYGLVRIERDLRKGESTTEPDAGIDVSYNLTPQLSGVLTFNTDFAETESDDRQINLTRFELFYPEKRAFFLEGTNQFEFGLGLGESFVPFFSRRIGLYRGERVPIDAGVKLVGRQGRWGIGALEVLQGSTDAVDSTSLFAGRVTYDFDDHFRLGMIATDGDPTAMHDNRLTGIDALWRTSSLFEDKNFLVGAWAARSDGDIGSGQRTGWGFKIDYPNDLWDLRLIYKEFGDALDPAMGFLPRPGTRWYSGGGAFQPRPQQGWWAKWVRQFFFETSLDVIQDLDGNTQSWWLFTAPFNVRTQSGEHLEANWYPQFERLTEPFEVADGVVIPPGDYRFTRYRVEASSSLHRPWQIGGGVWFGSFYSGHLEQWFANGSYTTPGGRLQVSLSMEINYGRLPEGDFSQRLWQLKTVYAFTPDLVLSAYAQFDSISSNLGVNTRLRWTIVPGTDLFVVWNRAWEHPVGEDARWSSLLPLEDQAVVKLRYTWRP